MTEPEERVETAKVEEAAPEASPKIVIPMPGILGQKIGMSQIFEGSGVIPVTAIKAGPCFVTQIKTKENDGYNAVQVAFGSRKNVSKPVIGHLKKAKLEDQGFRYFKEFRTNTLEGIELGVSFGVDIFKAGDRVRISGKAIGKGFAGTVKRYHFSRGPMAHGSKSHRIRGSSGSGTSPGRVRKRTRMAGRLGGGRVSVRKAEIVRVDLENNLILVKGAVPGKESGLLEIRKERGPGS